MITIAESMRMNIFDALNVTRVSQIHSMKTHDKAFPKAINRKFKMSELERYVQYKKKRNNLDGLIGRQELMKALNIPNIPRVQYVISIADKNKGFGRLTISGKRYFTRADVEIMKAIKVQPKVRKVKSLSTFDKLLRGKL